MLPRAEMERATDHRRLQRCVDDLVSVLGLPAMGAGQDAAQVVCALLEAVTNMLRLDFADGRPCDTERLLLDVAANQAVVVLQQGRPSSAHEGVAKERGEGGAALATGTDGEELVGASEGLREVIAKVARVAPTDSTVLVVGETGTGKELVARTIHRRSRRAGRAFIRVNCAAIPAALVASELFGHEKGAFTGALQRRIGRFEAADGGTIFLDEIGDLNAETQVALLRVLQEREFERVGSSRPIPVDVRIVAATHRDLAAAVKAGGFREDLFYRLNVFPIEIPPLRARRDDIHPLVQHMIGRYAKQVGKRIRAVGRDTLELLRDHAWPGNVRELQNVVERAVILSDGDTLAVDPSWLRRDAKEGSAVAGSLAGTLAASERRLIEAALLAAKGRVSGRAGAAARLDLPRQTLESKIRSLRIDKHRFKGT